MYAVINQRPTAANAGRRELLSETDDFQASPYDACCLKKGRTQRLTICPFKHDYLQTMGKASVSFLTDES